MVSFRWSLTVIIDPVLDFDPASGTVSFESLNLLKDFIAKKSLSVAMVLETHAHADHLSSAHYIKEAFPGVTIAIGENISLVQETFKSVFSKSEAFPVDGSQFDRLLKDNELVRVGGLEFRVIFTPGHTPACASYLFGHKVFTGDTIFMPDYGTGRCDFPQGSADDLYNSIFNKLYKLPDSTEVYVGHDYRPDGRPLKFLSTIGEQKATNIHIKAKTPQQEFTALRKGRDQTLNAPRLLLPSIQVNIDGGKLPQLANSTTALTLPIRIKDIS